MRAPFRLLGPPLVLLLASDLVFASIALSAWLGGPPLVLARVVTVSSLIAALSALAFGRVCVDRRDGNLMGRALLLSAPIGAFFGGVAAARAGAGSQALVAAMAGALLALPAAALVVHCWLAVLRAAAARDNSLVFALELRSAWRTAVLGSALASMGVLPALFSGCASLSLSVPQHAGLGLGFMCSAALLLLLLGWRDEKASQRLRRTEAALEEVSREGDCAPVDLGVGEDAGFGFSERPHYRGAGRPRLLLWGDIEFAREVLGRARRDNDRAQLLATLAVLVVLVTGVAVDLRELGSPGCLRRPRAEHACACINPQTPAAAWWETVPPK